jgi:hypothetical protein
MTNPIGEGVVDVKARNGADTGPCRHGNHIEEKKPCVRCGKGKHIYCTCAMDDVAKRVRHASERGLGRGLRNQHAPLAWCKW